MFPDEYLENWNPKDHPSVDQLKILWHSVAPHIRSGYGTVTRHVCGRLVELGYDLVVSAYYGIEPGGVIQINGIPCVPCARHLGRFGEGSYKYHYKAFRRNVGILHSDFWAFPWFPGEGRYSVLYSPMDHVDYGAFNVNLIKRYDRVISFLPFQQRELEKYGVESPVIPHGVDRVFKPMDKKEARRITRLPEEDFIVGIVAANSDKETRKSWGEIFRAAGYIRENFPEIKDLKYFVHSDPEDPKGVALKALAHKFGVLDIVAFEDPHLAVVGLPDSEMVLLYNSFDVLLNPARREGFGLPILEAMACGVPVIGHNFSSMPDLIGEKEERGWLAKTAAYIVTPINAITGIVDWKSVADCILDAYLHPDKVERKGKAAREFAKTMYWDDIIIDKWVPFLDEIAEDLDRRSDDIARIEF